MCGVSLFKRIQHNTMLLLSSTVLVLVLLGCGSARLVVRNLIQTVSVTPTTISHVPPTTLLPTRIPTPAAPPEGTITLEIVDTTQVSVTLPVQGQLLMQACSRVGFFDCCDDVDCIFGLLDLENTRLVRLSHLPNTYYNSRICSEITWSPDGRHFVCRQCRMGLFTCAFTIFRGDGEKEFDGHYIASWSPDGSYLTVITCIGNALSGAYTLTIYDTNFWEEVCAVTTGDVMVCGSPTSEECELPLADGRVWSIVPNNDGYGLYCFKEKICNEMGSCLHDYIKLTTQDPFIREYPTSNHYEVSIENYWLRIIDTETGIEETFEVPGYYIANFVWSPN